MEAMMLVQTPISLNRKLINHHEFLNQVYQSEQNKRQRSTEKKVGDYYELASNLSEDSSVSTHRETPTND
ncbi:14570_t:CDS:2 [Acaulospora morrowiae]|uniref:14570_t:CDS:1 n=1 Tax=Acaulospora morrowiae TaxID=94023 RepID=A0A9N9HX27_9GLOM|nr:14570_t:CDS:2 [Acaulospora morrowiae]